MRNVSMRLTQEVPSSMLLAVLTEVFTEMCSETIVKIHNIWVFDDYALKKIKKNKNLTKNFQ